MKKYWMGFLSGVLGFGILSLVYAQVISTQSGADPVYTAIDSDIHMEIKKNGKVEIKHPNGKKLKKIKVGTERPIDINKFLPGKVIKTIDSIVVFSGSPVCVWHDGWIICEDVP
jgi:hypothetical protein